jgi:phospholipase/carboxylesterase
MKTIHRLAPSGPATSLVILLHGYGADGQDLIDLGHAWRAQLPHTLFISPSAPNACEMGGPGFQWWSLAQGLSPAISAAEAERVRPALTAFIESERAAAGVPAGRVALVGFSQGCMLALHTGLRMEGIAAIVGYSGLLLPAHSPITYRPPVLLAHGMMDMVVPFAMLDPSAAMLRQAGVPVETLVRPAMGHGIDDECLRAGGGFLAKHLT